MSRFSNRLIKNEEDDKDNLKRNEKKKIGFLRMVSKIK